MKVLVACEFSGVVRDAFRRNGHDAWSCDLLPCDGDPAWHREQDVYTLLHEGWDMMIAHPPCTHLAVSGARHFHRKQQEQADALDFVRLLMNADIPRICIENPISIISSRIRKPDQIVQPWMFGHLEQKSTCLWLKNLERLTPTHIVRGAMMLLPKRERERIHHMPPSADRWKKRSTTYHGFACAMADQWGSTPTDSPHLNEPKNL